MDSSIVLLLLIFSVANSAPIVQPLQLYSALNTVTPGTVDVFLLDFTCSVGSGTLVIDVNQPNFNNKFGGVFAYISDGPSTGRYAPFPDPSMPSTFKWTTNNNRIIPLPSVTIPNAGNKQYYVTIDAPLIESPEYELSSQMLYNNTLREVGRASSDLVYAGPARGVSSPVQRDLFFGNKFVLNSTVDWNKSIQYEIPVCGTALAQQFGNKAVCLSSRVSGHGPGFLFYQYFSVDPNTVFNFWQTRQPSTNPYDDLSGRGERPINEFLSLPTPIKQLPSVLYHTVYGQGGQGVSPPYPNPFSVFYEWRPCDN